MYLLNERSSSRETVTCVHISKTFAQKSPSVHVHCKTRWRWSLPWLIPSSGAGDLYQVVHVPLVHSRTFPGVDPSYISEDLQVVATNHPGPLWLHCEESAGRSCFRSLSDNAINYDSSSQKFSLKRVWKIKLWSCCVQTSVNKDEGSRHKLHSANNYK